MAKAAINIAPKAERSPQNVVPAQTSMLHGDISLSRCPKLLSLSLQSAQIYALAHQGNIPSIPRLTNLAGRTFCRSTRSNSEAEKPTRCNVLTEETTIGIVAACGQQGQALDVADQFRSHSPAQNNLSNRHRSTAQTKQPTKFAAARRGYSDKASGDQRAALVREGSFR